MNTSIFPRIKDDVAIVIIGKMIAEQVAPLNELLAVFEQGGFNLTSMEVTYQPAYIRYIQRVSELNKEINQIYRRDNLAEIS